MLEPFREETVLELIESAKEASANAYVPYSGYPLGASVLTSCGDIFLGANIENISFGATVCAERTAVFKAVSEGFTDIVAVAVYSDSDDLPYPCGMCLQVISEFSKNCMVVVANRNGYETYRLLDLLPQSFSPERLGNL